LKTKWKQMIGGWWIGWGMAASALGLTVHVDHAGNYSGSWVSQSNGGSGFAPWDIQIAGGSSGRVEYGLLESQQAELQLGRAFSFAAWNGARVSIRRPFLSPLAPGDSLELDYAVNWAPSEGGTKGFYLCAAGEKVIEVVQTPYPGVIQVNGTSAFAEYGTGTMHWMFTRHTDTALIVSATPRKAGEGRFAVTVEVGRISAALDGIVFYASDTAVNVPYQQYSYFDNLTLTYPSAPGEEGVAIPSMRQSGEGNCIMGIPNAYGIARVEGADALMPSGQWNWSNLVKDVDYVLENGAVVLDTENSPMRVIRIYWHSLPN
jgi:hypothetical protein